MADEDNVINAADRAPGYYWLRDKEGRRPGGDQFIAQWDGEYWLFINSLFVIGDDELDEPGDAEPIMARYSIVERVREPSSNT